MSVRRPRGRRRVGDDWSSILLQGSQSQLRVGVSDPPCGCEAKRTSTACLRNQPEGPGPVGQGPNTLHRSLAMELRRQWASPAGCRGQLRLAISGRNGRSGARVDAHRRSPFAGVGRHWTTPRRIPTRPAPSPGGTNDSIPQGRARAKESARLPTGSSSGLSRGSWFSIQGDQRYIPTCRQPGFSGQARE